MKFLSFQQITVYAGNHICLFRYADGYDMHEESDEDSDLEGSQADDARLEPNASHNAVSASKGVTGRQIAPLSQTEPFKMRDGAVDEDSCLGERWRRECRKMIK